MSIEILWVFLGNHPNFQGKPFEFPRQAFPCLKQVINFSGNLLNFIGNPYNVPGESLDILQDSLEFHRGVVELAGHPQISIEFLGISMGNPFDISRKAIGMSIVQGHPWTFPGNREISHDILRTSPILLNVPNPQNFQCTCLELIRTTLRFVHDILRIV